MRITLAIFFIILAANALASTQVYSGWVAEREVFTAGQLNLTVLSTGDYENVVLKSPTGTVSLRYNSTCEYIGKYELCFIDYRFKTLGGKTRISGSDPEEYNIVVNELYSDASLSLTRTPAKTELLTGEKTKVDVTIKNEGNRIATDILYRETFPEYTTPSSDTGLVSSKAVGWEGALNINGEKRITYEVRFEKNGTYTIPAELGYFDGYQKKFLTQNLAFSVKNEYDARLETKTRAEPMEPAEVIFTISGTPKDIVELTLILPFTFTVLNTTFKKEVYDIFWIGNITGEKNLSLVFQPRKDGNNTIRLKLCYYRTDICTEYSADANITHARPDYDYFLEGKNAKEFKLFIKNRNRYAVMENLAIELRSDIYRKSIRLERLGPGESSFLILDKIDVDERYLQPFTIETAYKIADEEYKSRFGGNFSGERKTETIETAAPVNSSEAPLPPEAEKAQQAAAQPPQKDGAVKKEGIVKRFFSWLGSIFG